MRLLLIIIAVITFTSCGTGNNANEWWRTKSVSANSAVSIKLVTKGYVVGDTILIGGVRYVLLSKPRLR